MISLDPASKSYMIKRLDLIRICTSILEAFLDKKVSKRLFSHVFEVLKYMFVKSHDTAEDADF